jgi:hypothetical protein
LERDFERERLELLPLDEGLLELRDGGADFCALLRLEPEARAEELELRVGAFEELPLGFFETLDDLPPSDAEELLLLGDVAREDPALFSEEDPRVASRCSRMRSRTRRTGVVRGATERSNDELGALALGASCRLTRALDSVSFPGELRTRSPGRRIVPP